MREVRRSDDLLREDKAVLDERRSVMTANTRKNVGYAPVVGVSVDKVGACVSACLYSVFLARFL